MRERERGHWYLQRWETMVCVEGWREVERERERGVKSKIGGSGAEGMKWRRGGRKSDIVVVFIEEEGVKLLSVILSQILN